MQALARRGVRFLGSDTTGVVCFPDLPSRASDHRSAPARFATIARAIEAGYRPCRLCRPAVVGAA
ncbi:MAG: Ada metal-binding domain-containing protein [Egibacteraceae bacterium]